MKLSVRLQTFNHSAYIINALESIDIQITTFNFEVIIGDDFSTDNNRFLIDGFINRSGLNKKITYIHLHREIEGEYYKKRQEKGRLYNFINILENCNGKYIATIDGDDYWADPNKLQKQVDFLEKNKDVVLCYHDCKIVNDSDEIIADSKLEHSNIKQYNYTSEELKKGPLIPTLAIMFRNTSSPMPEYLLNAYNGDTCLISFLGLFGSAKIMKNISPAVYRVHEGGVWSTLNQREKYFKRSKTFFLLSKLHKDKETYSFFRNKTLKALSFSLYLSLDDVRIKEYVTRLLILIYRSVVLLNFTFLAEHFVKTWKFYIYPKLLNN